MKKANKKVNAALIIIGNEILSGRTQDINVMNLSKWLNEIGVKVEEIISESLMTVEVPAVTVE